MEQVKVLWKDGNTSSWMAYALWHAKFKTKHQDKHDKGSDLDKKLPDAKHSQRKQRSP
jgi:hypothetical protein